MSGRGGTEMGRAASAGGATVSRVPGRVCRVLTVLISMMAMLPSVAVHAQPPRVTAAPVRLVLPVIGVDARVASFDLADDLTMPAPWTAALVAWYTFSAQAGAPGNAVLAGHRDWQRQRGVFYRLPTVQEGDEVWLQDAAGTWYRYAVIWSMSVPDDNAPLTDLVGPTVVPSLTLITCSGVFDRTSGRYLDRYIVRGQLTAVIDNT